MKEATSLTTCSTLTLLADWVRNYQDNLPLVQPHDSQAFSQDKTQLRSEKKIKRMIKGDLRTNHFHSKHCQTPMDPAQPIILR